jgi:NAD-dependent dihydropyrimidine dehydrogenase PreA subunit
MRRNRLFAPSPSSFIPKMQLHRSGIPADMAEYAGLTKVLNHQTCIECKSCMP